MAELHSILSLTEAAEVAGISASRLRQLIEDGRLPGKKIGNSWAVLSDDLSTYLGRQRGAGRPDEKATVAGRLFVDLRSMSPIQINLTGPLPEVTLWFKVDNRNALEVDFDRLLVDVWLGQPIAEGAVLDRRTLKPNSWDESIRFHQYIPGDRAHYFAQRLNDPRMQGGGVTDLRIQLTAYFDTPHGYVVVYNNMITRSKGEYPIQLPPPPSLDPLASKQIPG